MLELLPSPPFTHANTATAKIKQISSILIVSFCIRNFSKNLILIGADQPANRLSKSSYKPDYLEIIAMAE